MQFEQIKGFGYKRILKLKEAGLTKPADLLTVFPSKYVFASSKITDFEVGQEARIIAVARSAPIAKFVRKGLSFVKATFSQADVNFECVWFNQPYVKKQIVQDNSYAIVGKIKKVGKNLQIYVTSITLVDKCDEIVTIYKPYNSIPSKILKEAILQILDNVKIEGQISNEFCQKNGLLPLNHCIRALHKPSNQGELFNAKNHAALQMLAFNLATFMLLKGQNSQIKRNRYDDNVSTLRKVINSLPYKLTEDQTQVVQNIINDLHSDRRMNRLIEGDVGCGKTIVAFAAMYYVALSGCQVALMAPTEILARQHYAKAIDFFGDIKCELLCSSQSKERQNEALFNIENGNAQIVIGTHAIFQDNVMFKNLALTVVDEQHRFGVAQRGNLENKGFNTDSLVMSATPIPRTLALTMYGDLDISVIKTLPSGKAKIFTKFVPKSKEKEMFDYIYTRTLIGEKSYVVCPRVEDEESISAVQMYKELKKQFGSVVGLIHGQMNEADKNKAMTDFVNGKIMILVCTTVIEVGIDVADAINIVIFDAERYGLSQLHQLRGRVGRGKKDSYCFLISKNEKPCQRLEYFARTNSGFDLAEYDFKQRGAGDFLGTRQHGEGSIFGGVCVDENLLVKAKSLSEKLIIQGEINLQISNFKYIKGLTLN
ncbi:MAG: ATP-dependent DNA helicase RecG [Clostridia bacterium]|nr:ATP-dependent DNA helicase RecG [Clostridia bacterium]